MLHIYVQYIYMYTNSCSVRVCSSHFKSSDQHASHFGIPEVDDDTVLGDHGALLVLLGVW